MSLGPASPAETPDRPARKTSPRIAPQPDLAGGERVPMADGGDMDEEAMRAFFPLSFGKTTARPSSAVSSAHSSTLRKPQNPSNPKPSTSAAADDDGGAMIGPPRPPPVPAGDDDDEEEGGGMIGPPRPPPLSAHGEGEDDEGGGMIGPPRPPPAEEDDMEDDGDGGFNRIPLSNEIVLRGHTKVTTSDVLLPSFIITFLNFCYTDLALYLD